MPRMPNLGGVCGFSSMFSLAILMRSWYSVAISSRIGAIILHGPHHSAQKSSSTGFSDFRTSWAKVASEVCTMCGLLTRFNLRRVQSVASFVDSDRRVKGRIHGAAQLESRARSTRQPVTLTLMSVEPFRGFDNRLAGRQRANQGAKGPAVLSSFVALPRLFCKAHHSKDHPAPTTVRIDD